jgi:hypothetical protein
MEMYGKFWLTARTKPQTQLAAIHFSEAIEKFGQYGAPVIVNRIKKLRSRLTETIIQKAEV